MIALSEALQACTEYSSWCHEEFPPGPLAEAAGLPWDMAWSRKAASRPAQPPLGPGRTSRDFLLDDLADKPLSPGPAVLRRDGSGEPVPLSARTADRYWATVGTTVTITVPSNVAGTPRETFQLATDLRRVQAMADRLGRLAERARHAKRWRQEGDGYAREAAGLRQLGDDLGDALSASAEGWLPSWRASQRDRGVPAIDTPTVRAVQLR